MVSIPRRKSRFRQMEVETFSFSDKSRCLLPAWTMWSLSAAFYATPGSSNHNSLFTHGVAQWRIQRRLHCNNLTLSNHRQCDHTWSRLLHYVNQRIPLHLHSQGDNSNDDDETAMMAMLSVVSYVQPHHQQVDQHHHDRHHRRRGFLWPASLFPLARCSQRPGESTLFLPMCSSIRRFISEFLWQ